jgi:hypothetical protein
MRSRLQLSALREDGFNVASNHFYAMEELWDARRRSGVTRRRFLAAGAAGVAASAVGPSLWRQAWAAGAPPLDPHLSFGGDAATEMTVSWRTPAQSVTGQSIRVLRDGDPIDIPAIDVRTVDRAESVYSHVALTGLDPGRTYDYQLVSDDQVVFSSSFTTAPARRQSFVFTALGDQGTDEVKANGVNAAVVAQDPALHFHVGDLCYAYRFGVGAPDPALDPAFGIVGSLDRIAIDHHTWDAWLSIISDPTGDAGNGGAHRIPWMATVGNHEMEPSYGATGYHGATGRLAFPGNGVSTGNRRDDVTYHFDYGNVRFIALDGNDTNFEITGNQGYLGASQTEWLESVLVDAHRPGSRIDFIVVGYHQCNYCTNLLHASDAGTRRWDALFREHGVDLVINGHNHSYERAHPFASSPDAPASTRFPSGSVVTPAEGPTFVTAGAGGNERVEVSAYDVGMASYVTVEGGIRLPEVAHWSAARNLGPSSFLRVDVDGDSGSTTSMTIRAIDPVGGVFDTVRIERPVGGRKQAPGHAMPR